MEVKNIMSIMVVALVGAVILTGFLPVLGATQETIGESVTYVNESSFVLKEADAGDVLKNIRTTDSGVNTDTWTFNNQSIVGPTGAGTNWTVGIMSDSIYAQINAPANASAGYWQYMDGTGPIHYFGNITVTFTDTEIQIVTGSDATSTIANYTWAYVICSYEEGEYYAPAFDGVGYVNKNTDVLLCGYYSTGELDCMYSYHNGQTYVSNASYTMKINNDLTLVNGTTDIYTTAVDVEISDGADTEHFTPFRIFVPYEVDGHKTAGALYDLYGLIPLIVAVGLLMFVITAILIRRV